MILGSALPVISELALCAGVPTERRDERDRVQALISCKCTVRNFHFRKLSRAHATPFAHLAWMVVPSRTSNNCERAHSASTTTPPPYTPKHDPLIAP